MGEGGRWPGGVAERDSVLFAAALQVFHAQGIRAITHANIAIAAGCSVRTVYRWAPTRQMLREKLRTYAGGEGVGKLLAALKIGDV